MFGAGVTGAVFHDTSWIYGDGTSEHSLFCA